jgi:hypothetical protein
MSATLDAVAEAGRRLKLERVQRFGSEPDEDAADLRPVALPVRTGRMVATLQVGFGDQAARAVVYYAAALFRADEVYLVADSRMTTKATEEPRHLRLGELQEEWEAGRRSGITECMVIYRMALLGPGSCHIYPYERRGMKLRWLEQTILSDTTPGARLGGAIPDAARQGFADAGRLAEFAPLLAAAQAMALDEAERDYHWDRGAARYASAQEGVGLVAVVEDHSLFDDGQER